MRSLSILFTNNTLRERAGSELWVRDVCRALIGRGHRPVAFSLALGAIADELRTATVPVVSSLDKVGFTPDLIHGHHHLETLIAALHFPDVPIVNFCHGFLPWEEAPLHHPSIARYVAVDATCADRLTAEEGIPPERIERLLNFVDLQRFAPRGPLPPRPRRALVLSNQAEPGGYTEMIREACQEKRDRSGGGRCSLGPGDRTPGGFAGRRGSGVREGSNGPGSDGRRLRRGARRYLWVRAARDAARVRRRCGHAISASGCCENRTRSTGIDPRSPRTTRPKRAASRHESDRMPGSTKRSTTCSRFTSGRSPRAGVPHHGRHADVEDQRAAARHLSSVAGRFKHAYRLERTVQSLSAELTTARSLNEQLVEERGGLRHQVADCQGLEQGFERTVQSLSAELTAARNRHERLVEECEGLQQPAGQLPDAFGYPVARRDRPSACSRWHGSMDRPVAESILSTANSGDNSATAVPGCSRTADVIDSPQGVRSISWTDWRTRPKVLE